jgi:hypothetical protein
VIAYSSEDLVDWDEALLDLLGRAGCVPLQAGVESTSPEGRALLDKQGRLSTNDLTERLIYAKKFIPFSGLMRLRHCSPLPARPISRGNGASRMLGHGNTPTVTTCKTINGSVISKIQ